MFEWINNPFVGSILTGLSLGGVVIFWMKKRINLSIDERINRIQNQREAFSQLLELWQERRTNNSDSWEKSFSKAAKNMMLWCPDDVLYHFSLYLQSRKDTDKAEYHFGNAVLCFRKVLGYKNKKEILTPKLVTEVYNLIDPDASK